MHLSEYSFNNENKILSVFNQGVVTLESFFQSWLDAINSNKIPDETVGFICINIDVIFEMLVTDYKKIIAFYGEHPKIFSGRSIAWVSQTTKNNLIPAVIALRSENINHGYSVQPFDNLKDAEKWILTGIKDFLLYRK